MEYADTVVRSVKAAVRNPFAVVLVSLAVTVSLIPFISGLLIAGAFGGLVGLWTSSFALGFVGTGGARISWFLLEREVSFGTEYFWEGIRDGTKMGAIIGLVTFVVALTAITLAGLPIGGIVGLSVAMIGVYLLLGWFVLATFALTMWTSYDDPTAVRRAFIEGGTLILERPASAVWLLIQTIGWTLLAIPLIIALVLVLPGFIQLIGTAIVKRAAADQDEAAAKSALDGG